MKQMFFKVFAVTIIAAIACIALAACGSGQSSSSASAVNQSSSIPEPVEVSQDSPLWGFWDGSDYADPTALAEDESFIEKYAQMDGIDDIRFMQPVYHEDDKQLEISYIADIAPFEWVGVTYMPALLQAELKMNDGTVVEQKSLAVAGANCVRFTCSDSPVGETVSVRLRAAVGPYEDGVRAYSKWTEWCELKVDDSSVTSGAYDDISADSDSSEETAA